jgi:serine/threonine protein kinase
VRTLHSVAAVAPSVHEDTDTIAIGAKAGPWVIEAQIGRGGMGAVYAVTHERIGKHAALKVMHRRLVSAVACERILTEARVVNRVGHANIVDIFETGALEDGRPYIVMERLDGSSLAALANQSKLLPDRVIAILIQISDALIAAHAAGIIHRDLKLDNVFLIENRDDPATPKVKVLDWGIAKEVENDIRQTIDGELVGTPQYLSPEQARGQHIGPPSDVYSLGVMSYELFLEQPPFEAETAAEIITMHLHATPPDPSELWPAIPRLLSKVLLQMLAKQPEERPSMRTVARTLEVVRGELEQRRRTTNKAGIESAVAILPRTTLSRKSAPALAATQLASRRLGRMWSIAGTFALGAAATMFILTREGSATATWPAASGFTQPRTVGAIANPLPHAGGTTVVGSPLPGPIGAPAASKAVTVPPSRRTPRRVTKPAPHATRTTPNKLDPNGTVDPYS